MIIKIPFKAERVLDSEFVSRLRMLNKVKESTIEGNTRCVLGRGGLIEQILIDSEFISIMVGNLREDITERELFLMGSPFGELRYIKLSSPTMGTLVYRNSADADLALRQLKGATNAYGTNIGASVKAQGLSPPVSITNITSSLVMSWPTSRSSKEVFLDYPTADLANEALSVLKDSIRGHDQPTMIRDVRAVGEICYGAGLRAGGARGRGRDVGRGGREGGRGRGREGDIGGGRGRGGRGFSHRITHGTFTFLDDDSGQPYQLRIQVPSSSVDGFSVDEIEIGRFLPLYGRRAPSNLIVRRLKPEPGATPIPLTRLEGFLPVSVPFESKQYIGGRIPQNLDKLVFTYKSVEDCMKVLEDWKADPMIGRFDLLEFHGGRINLTAQFTCRISVHHIVAAAMETALTAAISQAQVRCRGVRIIKHELKGPGNVRKKLNLNFEADDYDNLVSARKLVNSKLVCTIYRHRNSLLLFAGSGQQKFNAFVEEFAIRDGLIHVDFQNRTVRIYGSASDRQEVCRRLDVIISSLGQTVTSRAYHIHPSKRDQFPAVRAELKSRSNVDSVVLLGIKVVALGSAESLQSMHDLLTEFQLYAPATTSTATESDGLAIELREVHLKEDAPIELCCICGCEMDPETYQLRACEHVACRCCLENRFYSAERGDTSDLLPITCMCDSVDCGVQWTMSDVFAIASPSAYENIRRGALVKFLIESDNQYRNCCLPGCEQVIRVKPAPGTTTSFLYDEDAVGGCPVFCDQCCESYCYTCSSDAGEAMPQHPKNNCQESKRLQLPTVKDRVFHILGNILSIRCPRNTCQMQFIDFEGCFALTCTLCNQNFCAYCLGPFPDSSSCHTHVLGCSLGNNSFFNTFDAFQRVHRERWTQELHAYLDTIENGQIRADVIDQVRPHARAVGITI